MKEVNKMESYECDCDPLDLLDRYSYSLEKLQQIKELVDFLINKKLDKNIQTIIKLPTVKDKNIYVYLEYEPKQAVHFGGNDWYCTHCGKSENNKFWGHYKMTYERALKDFIERVIRGY
jgi:hypothetical protein